MAVARGVEEVRAGAVLGGKYRLLRPLASGGMGAVWVAHHQRLDIEVAIKLMDGELASAPDQRARFEREAKATAALKSQHVVHILDHGIDGDVPFIVMELLDGEDLGARLRKSGRLGTAATAALLGQVAKGLSRAHEAGIVHRDLKPANLFLARIDDDEVVRIVDFGVAKMTSGADGETTTTGVVLGSPNYMSPEQARANRTLDLRSDLWSLAVILFRCLTGKAPFRGETTADVIVKICAEPIVRPSQICPDLPAGIDAFFERALSRDPDGRFQSANDMVAAFDQAIGETDSQRRVPAPASDSWTTQPVARSTAEAASAAAAEDGPTTVRTPVSQLTLAGAATATEPGSRFGQRSGGAFWGLGAAATLSVAGVIGVALFGGDREHQSSFEHTGSADQLSTAPAAPGLGADWEDTATRPTVDAPVGSAVAPAPAAASASSAPAHRARPDGSSPELASSVAERARSPTPRPRQPKPPAGPASSDKPSWGF